jgi:phosphoglycolate phosphatase
MRAIMFVPRVIVFDLDGTLLDTTADIAAACNHALAATGRRTLKPEVIRKYVGDGARKLCGRAAGLTDGDDELDAVVDAFMTYYLEHPADHATWMPWAKEALEKTRGVKLALCTNKPRRVTERLLEAIGEAQRFACVVGGGDVQAPKPDPAGLLEIARRMRVDPRELVMVGDGTQDILAGRAAGCRTIAFSGGFTPRAELAKHHPDVIIESLADMSEIMRRWCESTVRTRTPT